MARIGGEERMRTKMIKENSCFGRTVNVMSTFCSCTSPFLIFSSSEYAQVIKMLGNGRLEAQCFDGEKRLAHIRGKMRKKVKFQKHSFRQELSINGTLLFLGMDKSGRHYSSIPPRFPRRQGRCHCQIHSRRSPFIKSL